MCCPRIRRGDIGLLYRMLCMLYSIVLIQDNFAAHFFFSERSLVGLKCLSFGL